MSWTGTHQGEFLGVPPTERNVRGEGIVIMRIADGKIAEEWVVRNLLGVLEAACSMQRAPSDDNE